jgi:hypothetical protein
MQVSKVLKARPGWITSVGALVSLVLAVLSYERNSDARVDSVRRAERIEIKADMRRELDLACSCCKPGATNGVR